MGRIYNFSAGPAALPEAVLSQARNEMLEWHDIGMSIMEVSHRGKHFMEVASQAEADLRELLAIPNNYQVLFLQGGAQLQFSMIPMNLLGSQNTAVYLESGVWSKKSMQEAARYCDVTLAASGKDSHFTTIPATASWNINPEAAYFYYVANETVNGLELPFIPETDLPLVADMSSCLLSTPLDVSKFGVIFACAQKNIGPAGLTIVIIREDLLKIEPLSFTPSLMKYALHADSNSMLNTPPTYSWYMAGLVFKWLKQQGGLSVMAEINQRKSKKLYEFIDNHNFYQNSIDPKFRSRMNVVFTLNNKTLHPTFLAESLQHGLANLKGHRLVGGMRASLYNAMTESGVDALITFMHQFAKKYS